MSRFYINGAAGYNQEDVLESIRAIRPQIKSLHLRVDGLRCAQSKLALELIGNCIRRNTSIIEVCISDYNILDPRTGVNQDPVSVIEPEEWEAFFDAVSQSRSIKQIVFTSCFLWGHILKLFGIPNLECVEFHDCLITRQTASAIRRVSCLQTVTAVRADYWDGTDEEDFIASLNHNHKLEFLGLLEFNIREGEARALGDILSDPQSIVKKLHLVRCTTDAPLLLLQNSLVNNSSLREVVLGLSQVTEGGWQVVSDILSSRVTALKVLSLRWSEIDDESAGALANGIAHNATLEELNLSSLKLITPAGWMSIFSSMGSSNLPLKRIYLDLNDTISDEVLSLFGEVLTTKNDTIEEFSLYGCRGITAVGWADLTAACLTPMPNLKELHMGNPNFLDGALEKLSSALHNKPCLKKIHLRWATMATSGWEALSKALCDTSSVDGIRESNHTLHQIVVHPLVSLPPNIVKLLSLNRSGTPSEVARLKMIEYSEKITVESLVNDQPTTQLKVVPHVIARLVKDGNNQNALYHFVRNQSYLFQEASRNPSDD